MTSSRPAVALDTNIVSYIFNQDRRAGYYEERLRGSRYVISFQTLEESWYGAYRDGWGVRRMNSLARHLEDYEIIWPNADMVEICAHLRSERRVAGRELGVADAWIAATALFVDCPLASHDRIFRGIPGLELVQAPRPLPPSLASTTTRRSLADEQI